MRLLTSRSVLAQGWRPRHAYQPQQTAAGGDLVAPPPAVPTGPSGQYPRSSFTSTTVTSLRLGCRSMITSTRQDRSGVLQSLQ